jgi:hypothetical protein
MKFALVSIINNARHLRAMAAASSIQLRPLSIDQKVSKKHFRVWNRLLPSAGNPVAYIVHTFGIANRLSDEVFGPEFLSFDLQFEVPYDATPNTRAALFLQGCFASPS